MKVCHSTWNYIAKPALCYPSSHYTGLPTILMWRFSLPYSLYAQSWISPSFHSLSQLVHGSSGSGNQGVEVAIALRLLAMIFAAASSLYALLLLRVLAQEALSSGFLGRGWCGYSSSAEQLA